MEYDIFISCKSEDYTYAEEIYQFLVDNGFNTFLASKELRNLGDSEYRRSISAAMKSTYHMILFASDPEYVDSTWVYYEWDMFINAKLKGFKPGQIVTILKDVEVSKINMDLWKYESFTFENYKSKLLPYMETPDYLRRKEEEKAKKKQAEEAAKVAAEQKRLETKREAKSKTIALAEEYKKKLLEMQSIDLPKLYRAMKKAEITDRVCPVCGTKMELMQTLCPHCCWNMSPLEGIAEFEYLVSDQYERIQKAKSQLETLSRADATEEQEMMQFKMKVMAREHERMRMEFEMREREYVEKIRNLSEHMTNLEMTLQELQVQQTMASRSSNRILEIASKLMPGPSSNHLSLDDFNDLLLSCTTIEPYSGIFDHSRLKELAFKPDWFMRLLNSRHNIQVREKELRACTTVSDLKALLGL